METVVVAGAGTMGAGIALLAAHSGFPVIVIEPDAQAQARARERMQRDAARMGDADAVSRVSFQSAPSRVDGDVMVIEAVPEVPDVKRQVLAAIATVLDPQAVIATNTSSLSVTELAETLPNPERFLGLHFFNPPTVMKLVEVIEAHETGGDVLARARSFVERLQRVPVVARDTPGFIVNRVARPFYLQAMRAYDAGAAPVEDLDRLARGVGFRMGPFELMDLIGLDVNLATSESIFERTRADRLEPVLLQRQMVAQNRLGRKTGAGFYDYASGPPPHDDALPPRDSQRNEDERVVVIGYDGVALELFDRLSQAYSHVELWQDEEALDDIPLDTTIAIDVGDGATDRRSILSAIDALLPRETVIFADAYATDVEKAAQKLQYPDRLVGYGVLSSLGAQNVIEIVDSDWASDDALELAQELFEAIGRRVALIEPVPALFLGRLIGSIVNEAVIAVEEGVASADDVDLAMRLGTNYPQGPIAWGREIGGARIARILKQLAAQEGAAFAPHRALYVLDVEEVPQDAG